MDVWHKLKKVKQAPAKAYVKNIIVLKLMAANY